MSIQTTKGRPFRLQRGKGQEPGKKKCSKERVGSKESSKTVRCSRLTLGVKPLLDAEMVGSVGPHTPSVTVDMSRGIADPFWTYRA